MKRVLSVVIILSVPLFLLATVRQTARFQVLRAEAQHLENLQKDWIEQNRKLLTSISVLSARARVDEAARRQLRLSPVSPEGILRIKIQGKGDGIDG